jgi:hypothetical protein
MLRFTTRTHTYIMFTRKMLAHNMMQGTHVYHRMPDYATMYTHGIVHDNVQYRDGRSHVYIQYTHTNNLI